MVQSGEERKGQTNGDSEKKHMGAEEDIGKSV